MLVDVPSIAHESNISLVVFSLPSSLYIQCFISRPNSFVFSAFYFTSIFINLPLFILVFYHGLQKWWQNWPNLTSATTSHSDCFTYHLVTMEMIGVIGCVICCWNIFKDDFSLFNVGGTLWIMSWFGETLFHILTCVERYLAVVHPIIYLGLKNKRGIRVRNIIIGCVWLICVGGTVSMMKILIIFNFISLIIAVAIVSFCSLSVLCFLVNSNLGQNEGLRKRIDHKKQRAFYTIMAILGVLVLRFAGTLIWTVQFVTESSNGCLILTTVVWLFLPSSLVIPLLFLYKAGKRS